MNSNNKSINLIKITTINCEKSIYIPINTIKNYKLPERISTIKLYDFTDNFDFNIKYELPINNINKKEMLMNTIISDNKKYQFISQKNNNFYLVENNTLEIVDNSLSRLYENKEFKFIVILQNKNLFAADSLILSYYELKNLSYKKFFNNLNKYNEIMGLCKLSNNRICYIVWNYFRIKIILYNEDFTEKEMSIKLEKEDDEFNEDEVINSDCKVVLLPNDIIFLEINSKLLLFDANYFEIITVFQNKVCYVLPFNNKNTNNNEDYSNYLAIVNEENGKYFLKIFDFSKKIFKESENIDINNLLDEENLSNINSFFDMNYEYNKNGNIIFIISFNSFFYDKLYIILEVNLDEIKYY